MTLYTYPITVEKEGKRYFAYSDAFPGVYGQGTSNKEAKESILEAMRLYIQHSCGIREPSRARRRQVEKR